MLAAFYGLSPTGSALHGVSPTGLPGAWAVLPATRGERHGPPGAWAVLPAVSVTALVNILAKRCKVGNIVEFVKLPLALVF